MERLQHWMWFGLGAGLTWALYLPLRAWLEPFFLDGAAPAVLARQLSEFAIVAAGFGAFLAINLVGWAIEVRHSSPAES